MSKDLIKKIINQANSLNKKIKYFKEQDIEEHSNLLHALLGEYGQYSNSGRVTKSTKYYKQFEEFELKKIYSALVTMNKNEIYGTPKKYEKYAQNGFESRVATIKEYFVGKGYDEVWITTLLARKDFNETLNEAFREGALSYGSLQMADKVLLNYADNRLTQEQKNKIGSNLEYAMNETDRILQEQREFERWKAEQNARR